MKTKDLLLIKGYLAELEKETEDYIRILSYADIDAPLGRMYPGENIPEAKARIKAEQENKLATLKRLREVINDEVLNADFHCKDGNVVYD